MIELHPLCTVFPRLSGEEYLNLKEDILEQGQLEPIYTYQGMILDGGNRYAILLECGIEPVLQEFNGPNPAAFVLSKNLHRRHLKAGQIAAITALAQEWSLTYQQGGDRKSEQSAKLHFDSAADRAAASGVSLRTQKTADKIAKKDKGLAQKVAHGEISLGQAESILDPKKPAVEPEIKPEDVADDLIAELEHAHATIFALENAVGKDQAEIIKGWQMKYAQLEGRLNAALTEKNEATKQAKYYKGIIDKVVKLTDAESAKDLVDTVKMLVGG